MKVCQALADTGHQLTVWLPGESGKGWDGSGEQDAEHPEHASAEWTQLSQHYGIRGGFELRRLRRRRALRGYDFCWQAVRSAQREGADLLYVWPYQAAAIGSLLGAPTLLELHDRPSGLTGPLLLRLFLVGSGKRRVLYTTEGLRESLSASVRRRLVPPFGLRAPNGVELARFEGLPDPLEARAMLGLQEQFTAGYAGQLYQGRGLELMFQLAQRMPDVRFLWVGGEPGAVERWRERAAAEALANLDIRGFVPNADLPRWLAACEALLMPYQHRIAVSSGGDTAESASPMKVFEYLAAGRAILSSDVPVLWEILNPANAVKLPADDADAWEQALRELVADTGRRTELGRQARNDAGQYSWTERARRALEGIEA